MIAFFYIAGGTSTVAISFERSRYFVDETSGVLNINLVTSHHPNFSFTVKLNILLGRYRTSGEYGMRVYTCAICILNKTCEGGSLV